MDGCGLQPALTPLSCGIGYRFLNAVFKRALFILPVLALILSGSGCKKRERAGFRFINRGDVFTLDLNQMSYMQDFRVTYAMREGLYSFGSDLKPRPALAEKVEKSADGLTWTFHLKKNARWSNGDPVTAKDFVFGWRYMLESPGEYTSLHFKFKNAQAYCEAYKEGKMDQLPPLGYRAVDDYTLEVVLVDPLTYLEDFLAFPPFYPRNEKSMAPFKNAPDKLGRVTYDARYTRPAKEAGGPGVVTNGAFKFVEWRQGDRLRFEKNEYYWNAANVKSDSVEMIVNNDPLSAFQQYQSGDVDWVTNPSPNLAVDLLARGRKDLETSPGFGTYFLTLNCAEKVPGIFQGKNPLSDVRVRQALAMGVDKSVITRDASRMGETPATNYVPPTLFEGYHAKPGLGYDVGKAKALLAEAGYPGGAGMEAISIVYNTDSPVRTLCAQILKNQWEGNLGVKVNVIGMEGKGYKEAIHQKKYAVGLAAWFGDYLDPSTFADKYYSGSENNDSNWGPKVYDDMLVAAAKELDPGKRYRILERCEDMVNTELPLIPLYYANEFTLVKPDVRGLVCNARTIVVWPDVEVVREKKKGEGE